MSIYEYDQEKYLRMEREDAKEEGRKELLEEQVKKKVLKDKSAEQIAEELEEDITTIQDIMEKSHSKKKKENISQRSNSV